MKKHLKNYFRLIIEGKRKGIDVSFWRPVLFVASGAYSMAVELRKFLYQSKILHSQSIGLPVISVGNISWGGVGKTPLVRFVADFFVKHSKVPLILTRGYGSDETHELRESVPQALLGIGGNRIRSAKAALASSRADVAILDDGFQHWQLARDLNIVVINVLNPFGNRHLVPSGILREPLRELKRADVIVFNDVNLISRKQFEAIRDEVRFFAPQAGFIEAQHEPQYFYWAKSKNRVELSRIKGKTITTFSGVGAPRSFQLLLARLGAKTVRNFEFCDHHPFSEFEIKEIAQVRDFSKSEYVVTTEKDLLRKENLIKDMLDPLILKISLRITAGQSLLEERLGKLVPSLRLLPIQTAAISTEPVVHVASD